ncbi:GDP-mannose 4,6-dehydratase, partial [Candidatus Woesearchaeota archaeon]|nr:GDP-mannose 4,6-dehydratase [Candidatus Woesearchaeota archaeon]
EAMPIPETCPLFPISHYGASKAACEAMISAYAHLYGMQAWICRFANVVGSRGTHGIIYDFTQKVKKATGSLEILGDGTQKKSYVLAEDIVDAMLFVLGNAKEQVNIFNLASSSNITVKEITELFAAAVQQKTGNAMKLNYTGGDRGWKGDVPLVILNPARLEKLGWKAKHDSKEAVKMAIAALVDEQGV